METRYIAEQFQSLGIDRDPFLTFIITIPRRFFQIFFLSVAFLTAITGREIFFMHQAESEHKKKIIDSEELVEEEMEEGRRGLKEEISEKGMEMMEKGETMKEGGEMIEGATFKFSPTKTTCLNQTKEEMVEIEEENKNKKERSFNVDFSPVEETLQSPHKAINAIIPLSSFMLICIGGLFVTGYVNSEEPNLKNIISNASVLDVLLWSVTISVFTSLVMLILQRFFTLQKGVTIVLSGMSSTSSAMFVLALAFTLGESTQELQLGSFVGSVLSGSLPAGVLPFLSCVVAVRKKRLDFPFSFHFGKRLLRLSQMEHRSGRWQSCVSFDS